MRGSGLILGIGTDICDAGRIARAIARHPERFVARIFTKAEIDLASNQADVSLFYAKRFAAKEAVYKALSSAGVAGLGWRDAEILNEPNGAPRLGLTGACKTALEALTPEGYKASTNLSLSDEPPYAVAFVIMSASPINDQ
jgi:holo-[acyl-carrier protein] synthase